MKKTSIKLAPADASPATPTQTIVLSKIPAADVAASAATFDDAQAAARLRDHAKHVEQHEFLLGLHCHWIKSQIKHGEFGPWLQKHMPELCRLDGETPKAKRQLSEAMKFCADAADKAGMTIGVLLENINKIQIPTNVGICHGGDFLLLNDADLPAEAKPLKEQLLKGIQMQLDFENGLKSDIKDADPGKKLSPTELHAELVKTQTALIEAATGALTMALNQKDVDAVLVAKADRVALDALCKQYRLRCKQLTGKAKKPKGAK